MQQPVIVHPDPPIIVVMLVMVKSTESVRKHKGCQCKGIYRVYIKVYTYLAQILWNQHVSMWHMYLTQYVSDSLQNLLAQV